MKMGIEQYEKVGVESEVHSASPHRLIQMLFEGLLLQLANAKGAIARKNVQQLQLNILKASNILVGLEEGLDLDKGGEIAINLQSLYQYMQTELLSVQANMSSEKLEALTDLVIEIKSGWDGIVEPNV